jgi:hypothetical protein
MRLLGDVEEWAELAGLTTVEGWVAASFDSAAEAYRGRINMAFNTPSPNA